jgi:hypothetical protein
MATYEEKILTYLRSIYPGGATNSEIVRTLDIPPHQQVFMITRRLMNEGKLRGIQGRSGEREWTFYAVEATIG